MDWILRQFFWSGLFKDVPQYCETCKDCQKIAKKWETVPMLLPMSITGESFKQIAMDIAGLLPKTKKGHQYILVVCDYAKRYPEAFSLRTFTAPKVAEKLIGMFTWYEITEEILTHQGTNFTSQLLVKLYELLGVIATRTSPYYPQADKIVEYFKQMLKTMLKRVLRQENKRCDVMLPFVYCFPIEKYLKSRRVSHRSELIYLSQSIWISSLPLSEANMDRHNF